MAGKRLTRKEIVRQDRFQRTLRSTSGWAVENRNLILKVAGGLVGLLLIWVALQAYMGGVDTERQAEFAVALEVYHSPLPPPDSGAEAVPVSDQDTAGDTATPQPEFKFETEEARAEEALALFRKISEEHSGTFLGDLANYYVGLCLEDLGKMEEARSALQTASGSDFGEVRNLARNALAQVLISAAEYEQAVDQLKAILEDATQNFPPELVLLRLARSYQKLGEVEDALRYYEQVVADFPGSNAATQAEAEIAKLPSPETDDGSSDGEVERF